MATADKKTLPITPLGDRVVVLPQAKEETSAMGIIIPDSAKRDAPSQGTVVAVGPGRFEDGKRLPMGVKQGDRVLFSKYGFDEVSIDGVDYYVLSESSILAVLS
jgi:chaperonin GroES